MLVYNGLSAQTTSSTAKAKTVSQGCILNLPELIREKQGPAEGTIERLEEKVQAEEKMVAEKSLDLGPDGGELKDDPYRDIILPEKKAGGRSRAFLLSIDKGRL